MRLSVIIPVLDEAARLPGLLAQLHARLPPGSERIVADGGSRDGTIRAASMAGARVVTAIRGRGPQQNAGAGAASGEVLWFVHADSGVPEGLPAAVLQAAAAGRWGCCAVEIDDPDLRLRLTARLMNRRARRTGACTGDMGIWIHRDFFEELGGFPSWTAFEDLALSDRARALELPQVVAPALITSARRWKRRGINRAVLELWALRVAYRSGLPPERLAGWWDAGAAPLP